MKRIAALVCGCLLAGTALAQTGYFQGVTPKPADVWNFPASLTVTRSAPDGGGNEVVPALYTHVTTAAATETNEWANLTILNNYANIGADVAVYGQANKYGNGTTWSGVFEAQDATGIGGFWGVEIDAFSHGPSNFDRVGGGDRVGLGIVLGRAFGNGPKATIDYGMWILPAGVRQEEADVNFGVMVSADCRYACYAMRANNKLAWEESAKIASKFDARTGYWGLYNGDTPVFEVNVATGEIRVNGRAVEIAYK